MNVATAASLHEKYFEQASNHSHDHGDTKNQDDEFGSSCMCVVVSAVNTPEFTSAV